MGITYNTSLVRLGLVMHLDAANQKSYSGTGNTWTDLSGNANHGTLVSAPTYNTNGYFVLNGSTQYATVNYSTSLWSTNNYTMNIWARMDGNGLSPPRAIIISKDSNYIDMNSLVSIYQLSNQKTISGLPPVAWGIWRNYTLTYDGTTGYFYENGIQTGSLATTLTIYQTTNMLRIGCYDGGSYNLNGAISMAQVYNRALSAAEVAKNFDALRGRYNL